MPKKKEPDDPKAQSERFKKAAQELIDDGELSHTDAEKALDALVKRGSARPEKSGERGHNRLND